MYKQPHEETFLPSVIILAWIHSHTINKFTPFQHFSYAFNVLNIETKTDYRVIWVKVFKYSETWQKNYGHMIKLPLIHK
jgi:hypothetical protein